MKRTLISPLEANFDLQLHNRQRTYPIQLKQLKTQTIQALQHIQKIWPKELREVDIYFVSIKRISDIHDEFLNDPTPTDVITFHHGEIFICPAVADKQRHTHKLTLHDELLIYIIHGLLHLCGYNDHTAAEFKRMAKKQNQIFQKIYSFKI